MARFFSLIFALLISFQSFAHGPTPQKVQESVTINVAPEKAWATIKNWGGVHEWLPGIESTTVEKKGDDIYRKLKFKSGGSVLEKLKMSDDKDMKLRFEIIEGDVPFTDFNGLITVSPGTSPNESIVQWTARFYRLYKLNPPIPDGQDDETALAAVKSIVGPGLENLKKVLETN